MTWVIIIVVVGAVVVAVSQQRKSAMPAESRLLHSVSGEYPSTCSWCRRISLAKKMTVLEKSPTGWDVVDVDERNRQSSLEVAAAMSSQIFTSDLPKFRRLCSEACVRAFVGDPGAGGQELAKQLVSCEYCGCSFLCERHRCPTCGAPARVAG